MDFTLIKRKLMHSEEGKGWTSEKADEVEANYKRFLILHVRYPGTKVVPDADVDDFWHQHILDTRRYPVDCEATFGYFFHHDPYFGMQGDREDLEAAAAVTADLLKQEFGDDAKFGSAAGCNGGNSRCRNCGGSH